MNKIIVDEQTPAIFRNNWKLCVGTGRLGLALQKEYIDHLKLIQENIRFDFIRGHGLFHDDIGIYRELTTEAGETKPFYNFTYIDRIFDMYLELGIRPFVELGFMPKLLASGEQTIFAWEGNVTPPADYDKWYDLIQATVSHFIDRYGLEEVLSWPFEVWNEPNLSNFWKDANKEEYFKLYRTTVMAVKDIHPDLQVGGPAICGGSDEWITDFLHFCKNESVPVDFVSRHAYTSAKPHKVTPDYYYQKLFENTHMLDELKKVKELIDASPFPHLPFHITEYNTSYSPINPVHDTTLNAAYLARILSEAGDYADSFSYWTFSDVFEEADVPKAQFHGGFGLIALNGIYKPTFHLFSFFNQLGEEQLYRDESTLVTRKSDGTLAIAVWNLVMETGEGYSKELELVLPAHAKNLFIKRQTIDEDHANPWKVWKQMGRPRFPWKKEVHTLQQAAEPHLRTARMESMDGKITLPLLLTKNEVSLIEITAIEDETDTYIGLDDSLIPSYSKEWS
ncbi:xylan 1,4-beta-xylosidase [Evansella caseinilytica]|uniref:Xylan 1,4-beta-xylosidase n=1 Tax=Evansella caseinilytica TaxID=1503961 RepID=A0A1H3IKS0_9BACI|nr:xylan 1,4-beta-xylosidase [Evansella caseinilytica]SDY28262.1 xylan 1,4-beta-xylosidase [Evansella caseinilytica]